MKNNRTFLEKLLDGSEVEWRTIAEISNKVSSGGTPATSNNSYYENGNIPWLRTQEVDFKEIWDTDIKITEEGLNNSSAKWIPENCVIIAMYGATVGKIAINKIPLTTNQACANIEVNSEIAHYRYVFHYLMSQYEYIKSLGSGSQTNINAQIVKKIKIPIPPLSVQTEIVKILDALTALTSELTSELTLRRKQYEYYREKLLSFDSLEQLNIGGAKKKLIDVAKIKNGKDWKHLGEGDIPIYGSGGIMGYVDTYSYDKPTVLIPRKGTITNIFYLEEPFWNVDTIYYTEIDRTQILPKYFYHFMKTVDLTKLDTGSGRPSLTQAILNEITIFVPSIEEQQRIVSILDKFETLTHSITEGLPLAIEQSHKLYEYYRELLLNFS